jgi:hypothetical protein
VNKFVPFKTPFAPNRLAACFAVTSDFWRTGIIGTFLRSNDADKWIYISFPCLHLLLWYLEYLILDRITAKRKKRISAIKTYSLFLILFLHNFAMMYLYWNHILTSGWSLLFTIPASFSLAVLFIMIITSKDERK